MPAAALAWRGSKRGTLIIARLDPARLRVCYVGGSITEQKAGWRPRTHEFLNTRFACDLLGHTAISASMGNVGSKVRRCSVNHGPRAPFVREHATEPNRTGERQVSTTFVELPTALAHPC
jgi:hypothetical protein